MLQLIFNLKNNKLIYEFERRTIDDVNWLYNLTGYSDTNEEQKNCMGRICQVRRRENVK